MRAWTLRRLGGSTGGSYSLLLTGRGGESRSKSKCICRFGDKNLWVLWSDGLHFLYESLLSGGPRDRLLNISVGWDKIRTLECKYSTCKLKQRESFL